MRRLRAKVNSLNPTQVTFLLCSMYLFHHTMWMLVLILAL